MPPGPDGLWSDADQRPQGRDRLHYIGLRNEAAAMTEPLPRSVIEPTNPKLNVSRNANLPHSPGIRVGDYIFLSGMGPVDPVTGGRNLGPIAEQIRHSCATWSKCSN